MAEHGYEQEHEARATKQENEYINESVYEYEKERAMAKRKKGRGTRRNQQGTGVGRKEEVGKSGVWPESAGSAPPDAAIRTPAEWGQGERGAAGYEDSGRSELNFTPEEAEAYQRERERREQAGEG